MTTDDDYGRRFRPTGSRTIQEFLGHRDIKTTLRYTRMRLPPDAVSPLDLMHQPYPEPPAPPHEELFGEGILLAENLEPLINPGNPLKSFYRLVRTHLHRSFGSMRRRTTVRAPTAQSPPPSLPP